MELKTVSTGQFKQTISDELLMVWKQYKRVGDGIKIQKLSGKSYPVVQRALKYGCVYDSDLISLINNFFIKRNNMENESAEQIKGQS